MVALNKIDQGLRLRTPISSASLGQLAEHELNPVEWGGATEVIRDQCHRELARESQDLLEILDYQAQTCWT